MNTKTLNEIRYLNAKRKYERYLREIRILREQRWEPKAGMAYEIFVEPFEDVFTALKLTAMDISNTTRLVLRSLLTFGNLEKLQKAATDFEDRQSRIRTKWDPIVEKSLEAIKTADPLFTFAMSPGAYMATQSMVASLKAGKTAAEIFKAENWDAILTQIRKVPDPEWGLGRLLRQQEQDRDVGKPGAAGTLSRKLANLFFGGTNEGRRRHTSLKEQNEEAGQKLPTDPNKWIESLLKDTGLDETFDDVVSASAIIRIDLSEGLMHALEGMNTVAELISARSMDEFDTAINDAISEGSLDQTVVNDLKNIMPQIADQARDLAQSEEFKDTVSKEQNIAPDKLTDDILKKSAGGVAFNSAKTQFDGQAMADLDKMMKGVEEIYARAQIDDETLNLMRQRSDIPEVTELLNVYEKSKRLYDETQETVRKIKGGG